ncbi:MAG: hypothetical protein PWR21_1675 [Methanoculleus sp.]|nr:hypothetical protein [Methanoculleus sp.]
MIYSALLNISAAIILDISMRRYLLRRKDGDRIVYRPIWRPSQNGLFRDLPHPQRVTRFLIV